MSVVLAIGQYLVRGFYVIGPLLIHHSCTENLLSAGPWGELSRTKIHKYYTHENSSS